MEIFGLFLTIILTSLASAGLTVFASILTWGRPRGRRFLFYAAALPFIVLGWTCAVIALMGVTDALLNTRRSDLGYEYQISLRNGYWIGLSDPDAPASLYGQSGHIALVEGVRKLQVAGGLVAGAKKSEWRLNSRKSGPSVVSYFLLETKTSAVQNFNSYADLKLAVEASGVQIGLQPVWEIYERFRIGLPAVIWLTVLTFPTLVLIAIYLLLLRHGRRFPIQPGLPPLATITRLSLDRGYLIAEVDSELWNILEPGLTEQDLIFTHFRLRLRTGKLEVFKSFSSLLAASFEHKELVLRPVNLTFLTREICFADDLLGSSMDIPALASLLFCVLLFIPNWRSASQRLSILPPRTNKVA